MENLSIARIKAITAFLFVIIFVSPFMDYIGFIVLYRQIGLFSIILFLFILIQIKVKKFFIYLMFLIVIPSFFTMIYYCDIYYLLLLSNTIVFLLFFSVCDDISINKFIDYSTVFLIVLEFLGILAFVYTKIGGTPLYSFPNPDGRTNYIFPFTFSNFYFMNFIRPAGIYDEPGALSFFSISIAILRTWYNKTPKTTLLLVLLGIITTSLTHILCCFILLPCIFKKMKRKERLLFYFICLIIMLLVLLYFYDAINYLIFSRLSIDETTGSIAGDTRSGQIPNTLKLLKDNGFLFGSYNLSSDYIQNKYGVITENPFSLLATKGLFLSLYYYVFLFFLFFAFLMSGKFQFLAMIALFVQRPYPNLYGYAFFFICFFYLSFMTIKNWFNKSRASKFIFLSGIKTI